MGLLHGVGLVHHTLPIPFATEITDPPHGNVVVAILPDVLPMQMPVAVPTNRTYFVRIRICSFDFIRRNCRRHNTSTAVRLLRWAPRSMAVAFCSARNRDYLQSDPILNAPRRVDNDGQEQVVDRFEESVHHGHVEGTGDRQAAKS